MITATIAAKATKENIKRFGQDDDFIYKSSCPNCGDAYFINKIYHNTNFDFCSYECFSNNFWRN